MMYMMMKSIYISLCSFSPLLLFEYMHYSRSSFVVVVVVVLVVLLYIVAIAVSSRQCASGSPGASSPSGPPLPPPLCLRYSRFEPNTFDPSGPVTLIAFVFSPSVASTSYSTFSLCIVIFEESQSVSVPLVSYQRKKKEKCHRSKQ